MLHHQRWCPNLRYHCRQKLFSIFHYSKSFKWIREVIRTQGKCINHIRIFENILWLSKISLVRRAIFKSYLDCPYKIVVVWDHHIIGNMDPCYQSNSNITEKDSFLHNVTRVLMTLQRGPRHLRKQPSIWDLRPPHSLDETARLPSSYQKNRDSKSHRTVLI